jgi:hypothetical protein
MNYFKINLTLCALAKKNNEIIKGDQFKRLFLSDLLKIGQYVEKETYLS